MSDKHSAHETRGKAQQMMDERELRFDERHVPPWVVTEAIGRAIDAEVHDLERRGDTFAVLVNADGEEVSDE